jgi:hypothetical protein
MFDEEKLIKNLDKKYVKCFLDEWFIILFFYIKYWKTY